MRWGTIVLGVALSGTAWAQDTSEPLTCEFLLGMVGTVDTAAIVDVIEGDRPIKQSVLRCLRAAEAPGAVVAAVERRLDKKIRSLDGDVIDVRPNDPYWTDAAGRKLADSVLLTSPGTRAFAVINAEPTVDPSVHWWFLASMDKAFGVALEALPEGSTAAESPAVLGDQARDLLGGDDSLRFQAEQVLINKGYTRLLVLQPTPVGETRAVDVTFVVRDLDGEIERNGRLRVAPVADASDVHVVTEVRPPHPAPGESVVFSVSLRDRQDDRPLIERTVDVLADGEKIATLPQVRAGTYEGPLLVPEDAYQAWRLTWTYDTDEGDLVSTPLVIPLQGHTSMAFTTDRSKPKRKAAGAGLMVGGAVALGAGVGLLVNGILWNQQLASADHDLTRDTYRQQTDAQLGGGAAASAVGLGMLIGGGVMVAPQKGGAAVAFATRF